VPLPHSPFDLEEVTVAEPDKDSVPGNSRLRSITEWYLARIDLLDEESAEIELVIERKSRCVVDRRRAGSAASIRKAAMFAAAVPVLIKDTHRHCRPR